MSLPLFYTEPISSSTNIVVLNEENSKHIVQVLRMQEGRQLKLTDGLGNIYTAEITEPHKKKCVVKIIDAVKIPPAQNKVCIAISPVKNNSRFEWFLEKATEIGVVEIVPLICERTEKQFLKFERLQGILISALLQSQQAWLPVLQEPIKFEKFVKENKSNNKFIAHCEEQHKISLKEISSQSANQPTNESTILIGPEGDFTKDEIDFALQNNFTPVALGNTRLRTETAGIVAAVLLSAF
ncbi:MAG: 16S rRNA (uracil(1498)-N(3))-methyltransferase [Ferruginibacter sp.]|nr:16S rRNA (uracil(1498)-N(3))-methyltransferase [Ferruginibacter sp.]